MAPAGYGPGIPSTEWGPSLPQGLPSNGPDISHHRIPDEKLTPEQLQRREARMEELRKLHRMLMADERGDRAGMTDYNHITMAQDTQAGMPSMDDFMYGGPHMGPAPGSQMPPMGHPGPPMGPGHPHHMGGHHGPMAGGPMPPMGPGGPMHPQMPGPRPMDMGMYPGPHPGPHMMPPKPPPPYPSPMSVPAPDPPRPSKAKKRKSSTQSPAPTSPLGQPLKSPKYQQVGLSSVGMTDQLMTMLL